MNKTMQLKARIKDLASKNHIPTQAVLQNYMLERLLERLSVSNYKDRFILKGGMLISSLVGINSRTTMDMDATLRNYPLSESTIRPVLQEICGIQLDDEVNFSLKRIFPIREDDEYGGYRVAVVAKYETIRTPLKIDITAGDVITPNAIRYDFPLNFENRVIEIWTYNIETVLAEKVETILRRSILNTRPRDYYDVYILLKTHKEAIDKAILRDALKATSEKRVSLLALENWELILDEIQSDATMRQRWNRYSQDNYYARWI